MQRAVINNGDGTVRILEPGKNSGLTAEQASARDLPENTIYRVTATTNIPQDDTFRGAWTDDNPTDTVDVDMPKAILIAHTIRRQKRAERFAPLDIGATIPSMAEAAEASRQVIRDEDAELQIALDEAGSPEELKNLLGV